MDNQNTDTLDELSSLDAIANAVHRNATAHGFHDLRQSDFDFIAHMGMNTHGELSELYDAYRAGKENDLCDKAAKMSDLGLIPLTNKEEELADLVIRALDISRRLRVDIVRAVLVKHRYNITREFKHGKLS